MSSILQAARAISPSRAANSQDLGDSDRWSSSWRKLWSWSRTGFGALVLGERHELGRRLIYLFGAFLVNAVALEGLLMGVAPYAQPALGWTIMAALFGQLGIFWRHPTVLRYSVMGLGSCLVLSLYPVIGQVASTSILAAVSLICFWTSLYLSVFWNLGIWVLAGVGIYSAGATITANTLAYQTPSSYPFFVLLAYMVVPLSIGALLRRDENARHAALRSNIAGISQEREALRLAYAQKAQELENSRHALVEAERHHTTGRIASGLAHELNNILTPIHGLAELLVQNPHSAQTQRYAESILHSAQSASMMTQALLTYTRQGQFDPMVLESSQLFSQIILPEIKGMIPEHIQLHTDVESGILLDVDRRLMLQTVWHLLRNAIEAMPTGGVLMLSLRMQSDKASLTSGGERQLWARITVSDTGKGIAKENLNRVFDPFFTTKTFGVGAGLGLALVHGAVTQHGGQISMESQLARGTSLHIDLPAVAGQAAELDSDPTSLYLPTQTRVLVATPDHDLRDELEEQLVEHGYAVDCYASLPTLLQDIEQRGNNHASSRWIASTWILDAALVQELPPQALLEALAAPEAPRVLLATNASDWPNWSKCVQSLSISTIEKPLQLHQIIAFLHEATAYAPSDHPSRPTAPPSHA